MAEVMPAKHTRWWSRCGGRRYRRRKCDTTMPGPCDGPGISLPVAVSYNTLTGPTSTRQPGLPGQTAQATLNICDDFVEGREFTGYHIGQSRFPQGWKGYALRCCPNRVALYTFLMRDNPVSQEYHTSKMQHCQLDDATRVDNRLTNDGRSDTLGMSTAKT